MPRNVLLLSLATVLYLATEASAQYNAFQWKFGNNVSPPPALLGDALMIRAASTSRTSSQNAKACLLSSRLRQTARAQPLVSRRTISSPLSSAACPLPPSSALTSPILHGKTPTSAVRSFPSKLSPTLRTDNHAATGSTLMLTMVDSNATSSYTSNTGGVSPTLFNVTGASHALPPLRTHRAYLQPAATRRVSRPPPTPLALPLLNRT